jgi:hypothetical protein
MQVPDSLEGRMKNKKKLRRLKPGNVTTYPWRIHSMMQPAEDLSAVDQSPGQVAAVVCGERLGC